jgi:hypothetical protein
MGLLNHIKLSAYKAAVEAELKRRYNCNLDRELHMFAALNNFSNYLQASMELGLSAEGAAESIYEDCTRTDGKGASLLNKPRAR